MEEWPIAIIKDFWKQPQAAHYAYIHGLKSKCNVFNYFIPTVQNHVKIIEDVLRNHFIPAIIGESSISDHLGDLIALHMELGQMAVTTPHLNTETECIGSRLLSKNIINHITNQGTEYKPNNKKNIRN